VAGTFGHQHGEPLRRRTGSADADAPTESDRPAGAGDDAAGYGRLRPDACLAEVHRLFRPLDVGKPGRSERMEDGR
jgi:hypothetical protein